MEKIIQAFFEGFEMTPNNYLIFCVTFASFCFLFAGIIKKGGDNSQRALTWLMYCLLDSILMFSVLKTTQKDGDGFAILFGSSICSFVMFIILACQKKSKWGWLETTVAGLVFICIVVWIVKGPYESVRIGIISEIIVGTYLIIETVNSPRCNYYNIVGYLLFLLASIISVINAKDYSLPEYGYAFSEIVITTATIIIPWLIHHQARRFKKKNGLY